MVNPCVFLWRRISLVKSVLGLGDGVVKITESDSEKVPKTFGRITDESLVNCFVDWQCIMS